MEYGAAVASASILAGPLAVAARMALSPLVGA